MCGNSITLIVIFEGIKFINLVVLCFKKWIYQIQFLFQKSYIHAKVLIVFKLLGINVN